MAPCIWYVSKYVIVPEQGEPAGRGFGLMREFARLGYESVIVTSDSMGKFDAPEAQGPYALEKRDGVTLCRIPTMKYSKAKSVRRALSWVDFERELLGLPADLLPKPDVIVASSLSLLTILNGLRLRRRYQCRLVFEVRDIWPLTLVEEGGYSAANPFILALGAVERLGYRRADAIVGTMPNLGAHVERVTGESYPTYCIPMGVDEDTIQDAEQLPADFVSAYIPPEKFLVGYAGSIGITNALDVFFECVESMQTESNIHFVVLGDGELRQEYVNRHGTLPNLTFAPHVPKAQVQDFLSRCDLVYFSTHNSAVWDYGQSLNKIIDYMMSGKPIVASYSGFPSMVDESGCGSFVPAGDMPALRDEIRRHAGMPPEELRRIGDRGREWLMAKRGYRQLAKEYVGILIPSEERS